VDRAGRPRAPRPGDTDKRTVAAALADERPRLLPLPAHPFGSDAVQSLRSGKTPYLRFDGNDYSIPHTLVRKPLILAASDRLVRVLDGDVTVASHERSWERGRQIEDRVISIGSRTTSVAPTNIAAEIA